MPQVILHVSSATPDSTKANLVQAVREVIPTVLRIDEGIGWR